MFLLLITSSCQTVKESAHRDEFTLPKRPERQTILTDPRTGRDYAAIIAYYDSLVKEWESWADDVENIVNGK